MPRSPAYAHAQTAAKTGYDEPEPDEDEPWRNAILHNLRDSDCTLARPNYTIDCQATTEIAHLLSLFAQRILHDAPSDEALSSATVQAAALSLLTDSLAHYAQTAMHERKTIYFNRLPQDTADHWMDHAQNLVNEYKAGLCSKGAVTCLAVVLDYLCAELVDTAGNWCRGRTHITATDLHHSLLGDPELDSLRTTVNAPVHPCTLSPAPRQTTARRTYAPLTAVQQQQQQQQHQRQQLRQQQQQQQQQKQQQLQQKKLQR